MSANSEKCPSQDPRAHSDFVFFLVQQQSNSPKPKTQTYSVYYYRRLKKLENTDIWEKK